jgi:hypothetical protein
MVVVIQAMMLMTEVVMVVEVEFHNALASCLEVATEKFWHCHDVHSACRK